MVNLDAKGLRYMTPDEMRVLLATEMGMKNHEQVPSSLIEQLSGLKRGGAFKVLKVLAKNKLVGHESIPYESFRLTSKGYDWLALRALSKRGSVENLGIRVGMGKESDIYTCTTAEGEEICIKLHRLGRNCFRTVKNNRDYLRANQSASWLYLSRLSALKEYAFMKALYDKGFPTPTPIDVNRHCVLMSLVHGYQLNSIAELRHPGRVFDTLMQLICKLAGVGLIHCDFNEFNLLVDDEERVTMIDFPQMVSTSHINAEYYFDRDVECVRAFFARRFHWETDAVPTLQQALAMASGGSARADIDVTLKASGWSAARDADFEKLVDLEKRELAKIGEEGGDGDGEEDGAEGGEDEDEDEDEESDDDEEGEGAEVDEKWAARDQKVANAAAELDDFLEHIHPARRAWLESANVVGKGRSGKGKHGGAEDEDEDEDEDDAVEAEEGAVGGATVGGGAGLTSELLGTLAGTTLGATQAAAAAAAEPAEQSVPEKVESKAAAAADSKAGAPAASATDAAADEKAAAASPPASVAGSTTSRVSTTPRKRPGSAAQQARIAEKVKLERGRHAARAGQSGKTSRNEHKDRDRRKIASNVKASAMAHRETWG